MKKFKLNDEQAEIVNSDADHKLIRASAGTGKTVVVTSIIQRTVQSNPHSKVLVLSLMNRSTSTISERLAKVGLDQNCEVSTFHALGMKIIRKTWELLGFTDKPKLIKTAKYWTRCVNRVLEHNQSYINDSKSLKGFSNRYFSTRTLPDDVEEVERKFISLVEKKYTRLKKRKNLIDYSDMIAYLSEGNSHVTGFLSNYDLLAVDELQDCTLTIANFLVEAARTIGKSVLVGDEKQCINQFMGSTSEVWPVLDKLSPEYFHLSVSFRHPERMVGFINKVAKQCSPNRKRVSSYIEGGVKPIFKDLIGSPDLIEFIASEISHHFTNNIPYKEMVVIVPEKRMGTGIATALSKNAIPVIERYRDENPCIDVFRVLVKLALLYRRNTRIQLNSTSQKIMTEFFLSFGISNQAAIRCVEQISKHDIKGITCKPDDIEVNVTSKNRHTDKAKALKRARAKLAQFRKYYRQAVENTELRGGWEYLGKCTILMLPIENKDRFNMNVELNNIKFIHKWTAWNHVNPKLIEIPYREDSVSIETIHGSKSKEWDVVFVPCLVDGVYPYRKTNDSKLSNTKMREEANKFYVAATRSKAYLYLITNVECRTVFNKNQKRFESTFDEVSPFLKDLEPYYESHNLKKSVKERHR